MKLTTSIKSFYRISKPSKTMVDASLQEKKFRLLGFQTFLAGWQWGFAASCSD